MLSLTRPFLFFFFNDTATTEIYTLSLHDALPIFLDNNLSSGLIDKAAWRRQRGVLLTARALELENLVALFCHRSEEHTFELQSHLNLVCRLLLEKKKKKKDMTYGTWLYSTSDIEV